MPAYLQHRVGEWIEERYLIERVLGSGAFGTVYLCRDRELNTLAAIKELHVLDAPKTATNEREAALAQFRREAVNLSQLRHPHIVSGHYEPQNGTWLICPICGLDFKGTPRCPDHGAEPVVLRQRHYLVMEHLAGPDLDEAARHSGGALKIADVLRFVREVAEALQRIHARGFLHRDIKPENIRLRAPLGSPGDDAVLLDFGIATEAGETGDYSTRAHKHTQGGGTLGYAPESPNERRMPDARSDIHALGMTLYRLVSGRDPLDDGDLEAMRRLPPRALNSAISPELETLILKSISSEPKARPQNANDFLEALLTIISPPKTVSAPQIAHGSTPEFVFKSGERAQSVEQLVRLLDTHRQEAKEYLYHGDLAMWLAQIGRADLAGRAREITNEYPDRKYQGLEALAQSTGIVPPPSLEVVPRSLDFGKVAPNGKRTLALKLQNDGRGHLFGILRSASPGLVFSDAFEGNRHTIPVTLEAKNIGKGRWNGEIVIDSSAGEVRVPCGAEVRGAPSFAASLTVWGWAMLGMLCGQQLRSWPLGGTEKWLGLDSTIDNVLSTNFRFGLGVWLIILLLSIGEATRRKSWPFLLSGATVALPAALLCAAMGAQLLIAGDVTLHPLMFPLVAEEAAGGWMVIGGILGASYGTLRRLDDVFSSRLLQILFGWLLFTATMYGILYFAVFGI